MASTVKWFSGTTIAVPMSGNGINSFTNNQITLSSGIDTSKTNLSLFVEIEGIFNYTVAPTANTGFSVWFLRTLNDVVWESGGASYTPNRVPDVVLPLQNIVGNQRTTAVALIPPGDFLCAIKNDGTGQTTASTLNDLNIRPLTYQIV
jgi:hypothetical protein